MIWLQPWAWLGLAAVALPVLVHWLARHEADRRVFPTVRFVPPTPPTSVRRHRLTDVGLLAVRAAIVAAAAAALAAPALVRPPGAGPSPARAIVVDTSASMARPGAGGRPGTALAEEAVSALAPTPADLVVRAGDPRRGVAQAASWLREQPGATTLVVVSDFQRGGLTEADLDVVPAWSGRRFTQIVVAGAVPAAPRGGGVRVYGAPLAEAAAKRVSGRVSGAQAPETLPETLVIVFSGAPEFESVRAQARPLDSPALYTLARAIDPEMTAGTFLSVPQPDGASALAIFTTWPPASVEAAGLIARALQEVSRSPLSWLEREPDTLPSDVVAGWVREARPDLMPSSTAATPLARWLWAVVLLLLGLETWMRRSRVSPPVVEEVAHARVA